MRLLYTTVLYVIVLWGVCLCVRFLFIANIGHGANAFICLCFDSLAFMRKRLELGIKTLVAVVTEQKKPSST